MKTSEFIEKYGEEAYKRWLEQKREWKLKNPDIVRANNRRSNPEHGRKGGKRYEERLEYKRTGLQGERNRIRNKHGNQYRPYKNIIAPDSELHHEWIPQTAEYRGLALVEANPHRYGFIDVIQILDGEITILTEKEIKNGGESKCQP